MTYYCLSLPPSLRVLFSYISYILCIFGRVNEFEGVFGNLCKSKSYLIDYYPEYQLIYIWGAAVMVFHVENVP